MTKLKCSMTDTCDTPVASIDVKGYVYCKFHGTQRRATVCRTRLLKRDEITRLESGLTIVYGGKRDEQ